MYTASICVTLAKFYIAPFKIFSFYKQTDVTDLSYRQDLFTYLCSLSLRQKDREDQCLLAILRVEKMDTVQKRLIANC